MSTKPITVAYADPPYPGKAKLHYGSHPDYAGEVDFAALIGQLVGEYPEGWALSCNSTNLRDLLPMCPPDVRVGVWCKPWAVMKKNVHPTYAWEPVIYRGGRNVFKDKRMVRDYVTAVPVQSGPVKGSKPEAFCFWLFLMLGLKSGDTLVDLFPGSGAVLRAWERWQRQLWAA